MNTIRDIDKIIKFKNMFYQLFFIYIIITFFQINYKKLSIINWMAYTSKHVQSIVQL